MPNIVNLHTVDTWNWIKEPNNVYIGRQKDHLEASKWANPHIIRGSNNRSKVILLYEDYLHDRKDLQDAAYQLKGKVLGCWCSPLPCHGEILHRMAGNRPIYQGYY